jgi:23S rRNA (guanosine2251-2'-O)-methyltransferase
MGLLQPARVAGGVTIPGHAAAGAGRDRRHTHPVDIIYGRNPVREALRAGRPTRKLVLADGVRLEARLEEILERATEAAIPIEYSPRQRLIDIAHSDDHQGVVGYFHSRPPVSLDQVLAVARRPELLLLLDGIQDPHNLGALARTADATGVDGIVVPRRSAAQLSPAVAKASAGAISHLQLCAVPNLAQSMSDLHDRGLTLVGLDADAPLRYDEADLTGPVGIVVGSEGQGMRPLTRQRCDQVVQIPMLGHVSSLNATVAGSLLLYEVARQRGFPHRSA